MSTELRDQSDEPPLFLNSYYFSFDATGVEAVDRVLEAVAIAGKAYHSTESWDESPYGHDDEPSYAERIQIAANNAAVAVRLAFARSEAIDEAEVVDSEVRVRLPGGRKTQFAPALLRQLRAVGGES